VYNWIMRFTLYCIRRWNQTFKVVCTNVDPNLIADQRNIRDKYLQNCEENWTKK